MFLAKLLHRRSKAGQSKGGGRAAAIEWKVVSTASGLLASLLVRRLVGVVWQRLAPSGQEPPLNPADRRIGWPEALAWSISAGAGAGVARLVSDRLAAAGWEMATGEPPPGLSPD